MRERRELPERDRLDNDQLVRKVNKKIHHLRFAGRLRERDRGERDRLRELLSRLKKSQIHTSPSGLLSIYSTHVST